MAVDLELAYARWQQAETADNNQRKREREDLSFYEGEGQWPEEIKMLRKGQTALGGMPAVPARPCLTINTTKDPVRHTINEFLQADLGVSVIPSEDIEGESVDEAEIELREGLIRRIQRQSNAEDARLWAASRAVISGRGFYGVMTRDVPGKTFDQEIYYRRFYNQFSVMIDPAHEQPDGSDADWWFIGTDIPWNIYKAEYATTSDGKDNPLINVSDDQWRAYGAERPKWFATDGETRSVHVEEYWSYEHESVEYVLLDDGSIVEAKDVTKDFLKTIPTNRRKRSIEKRVKFAKIDGAKNVLEETDWPGRYIPNIKIVGEEMHPFDDERRDEGMVRAARDSQQAYNVMISAAVEIIGLAPKAPWQGYKGQFEGFEQLYDLANTRTIGRLEANAVTDDTGGQILPLPQRQTAEPPIQAMAVMIQMFRGAINGTIGIPDPTLGNVDPSVRSGKAIRAMVEQSLRGTSNYLSNAIKSAHYEGLIVNDLLEPVYGRAGRFSTIMTPTNETRMVMLQQPFVTNTKGRPERFDAVKHQGQQPQHYQLTKAGSSANVAIKVSKHFDTRREQESAQLAELIGEQPELMTWFGDLFFKNQDSPGHQELAVRARAMLAPPIQKILAADQPPDPEKIQMQQALEAMQAELGKLTADKTARLETAQIKAQSDAERATEDNAVKLEIERIRAATQLEIADFKSSTQQMVESNKLIAQQLQTIIDAAHETRLDDKQKDHEALLAGVEHRHESNLTAQEHAHALEQAATEAALAPEAEATV